MERLVLISAASILIAAVVLWGSYNFYVDYTFKQTCEGLRAGLENSLGKVEVSAGTQKILEGIKSRETGCDVFRYLVKISQADFIAGVDDGREKAPDAEIGKTAASLALIEHVAVPKECGAEGLLKRYEREYCAVLHEENYKLIKVIEAQGTDAFGATLINCLSECINEDARCAQACWDRKTSTGS